MATPTVEEILDQRRRRDDSRQERFAALVSLGLHLLAVAVALLLPLLTTEATQTPKILPVRLVPMQRQGRVDAPPEPKPRPPERRPAEPAPEPEPPTPEPAEPEPRPVVPPPEPAPSEPMERSSEPEPAPPEPASPPEPEGRLGSPEGDPLGSSAFGARIAGVDPGFTHDSYLQRMLARIETEWRRPALEGQVEAIVHFVVEKDGTVRDLRIAQSSGHRPFDLAAVRAVQNASPLPPLPRSYRKDSLGVNLIVR